MPTHHGPVKLPLDIGHLTLPAHAYARILDSPSLTDTGATRDCCRSPPPDAHQVSQLHVPRAHRSRGASGLMSSYDRDLGLWF